MFIENLYSNLPSGWDEFFIDEVKKELIYIESRIKDNYGPNPFNMFKIFYALRPEKIKMFMLGNSPNTNCRFNNGNRIFSDQGIAFSQFDHEVIMPKNQKIIKNLEHLGYPTVNNACKLEWVVQGCFLINKSLTFSADTGKVHDRFWNCFIIKLLRFIIKKSNNTIFIFFDFDISQYEDVILNKGFILKEISPYDHKFEFDSELFNKINIALKFFNHTPINWITTNI